MATVINVRDSIPSLPDEPHHPKSFAFPKRSFGKTKPVFCSAKSQWFDTWPFLHYDEGQDVMFCHTCVTAFKLGRIKSSKSGSRYLSQSFVVSAMMDVAPWLEQELV